MSTVYPCAPSTVHPIDHNVFPISFRYIGNGYPRIFSIARGNASFSWWLLITLPNGLKQKQLSQLLKGSYGSSIGRILLLALQCQVR